MNQKYIQIPPEYLVPLDMNGLRGRMLKMPPPKGKKREILMVYGHHSSLERYYSMAQVLNDYAGVTLPDLPGFGGMDSFYKIHEKPDLDTMADYLASFVKLRYKKQSFSIAAFSYGFIVVTRMLQRYPEITKQVDLLISVVGFVNQDEFNFSKSRHLFYKTLTNFFVHKPTAGFFHNVILHPTILRAFYSRTHNAKVKFEGLEPEEHRKLTEFEIYLWRINDVRTYMAAAVSFLTFDNTKIKIDLPVWHIYVETDNYFNNVLVEQHMRQVFTDYHAVKASVKNHMPNVLAGKEEASTIFPSKILKLLRTKPKK